MAAVAGKSVQSAKSTRGGRPTEPFTRIDAPAERVAVAHHLLVLRVIFGVGELGGHRRQLRSMGCGVWVGAHEACAPRGCCWQAHPPVEQPLTLSCLEPTSASAIIVAAAVRAGEEAGCMNLSAGRGWRRHARGGRRRPASRQRPPPLPVACLLLCSPPGQIQGVLTLPGREQQGQPWSALCVTGRSKSCSRSQSCSCSRSQSSSSQSASRVQCIFGGEARMKS